MPSAHKKNAILTAALGYGAAEIAPLVESLAGSGFDGDLVVFTSSLQPDARDLLREHHAIEVAFPYPSPKGIRPTARYWPIWRKLLAMPLPEPWKDTIARKVLHHTYLRFILYRDFLRAHRDRYEAILLTDSRDVFFQANPFSSGLENGVHVYLESPKLMIGDCPYHSKWISDLYGSETLDMLAPKPRVCSGTTLGDSASILNYLDLMRRGIFAVQRMNTCGDQAIHNYLFHTGQISNVHAHAIGDGGVITLGNSKYAKLSLNSQGQVLDAQGAIIPILHQYDRVPELLEMVTSRHRSPVPEIFPA